MNSEHRRRKPVKRSHREAVGAAVVNSELLGKVVQRIKTMAGVKAFLILTMTTLHLAVVSRRVRTNELMSNAQLGSSGLKQSR